MCPIEVKCPETCIGKDINVDYLVKNVGGKFDHLVKDDKGIWKLSDENRGPGIMLQVQLEIFLAKAKRGFLFVWSDKDYVQLTIDLSEALV